MKTGQEHRKTMVHDACSSWVDEESSNRPDERVASPLDGGVERDGQYDELDIL